MDATKSCLREWNATVEALGQGKQTIIIRSYGTTLNSFLLYPTSSYALKNNFIESFQKRYRSFVGKNALPIKDGDKTEIKYYATVEKIIEKYPTQIGGQNTYIWTNEHVKSYLKGKKPRIWVLRVYKLKKPYLAESKFGAIKYAKLSENVSLEGIKPVLSDLDYEEKTKNLK